MIFRICLLCSRGKNTNIMNTAVHILLKVRKVICQCRKSPCWTDSLVSYHTLLCMSVLFLPALQVNFDVLCLLFISSILWAALKPTNLKFYSLAVLQISVLNVSNSCLALFLWWSLSSNLFWYTHLALCFWFVNLLWWKLL